MKLLTLLLLLPIITGCASNERYTSGAYAPVDASHVQVVDIHNVGHPYTIIGEVQGFGLTTNGMREKAAAMGADAITLPVQQSAYLSTAQAIKYKD